MPLFMFPPKIEHNRQLMSITMKQHALVNPALSSTSKQPKATSAINWKLCVLCQTETDETLQCPARSSKLPVGSGYMLLAENLNQFKDLGIVPMDLDVEKLDKGIGIQETLMIHSAKWHKTCSLKFNKQALQRVSRKQTKQKSQNVGTSGVQTRSAFSHTTALYLRFFCNEPAGTTNLHKASTHKLDMKVQRCALQLEDRKLLAKLSAGDMIALEAKYHRNCLTTYNKARQATEKQEKEENYSHLHGIAFAELVAYMEDMRDEESVSVFKLIGMVSLYKKKLQQLGVTVGNRIQSTCLKGRLLSTLLDLTVHLQGREILLTFKKDIGLALIKACDGESDVVRLMRAAQIICKELLNIKIKQFDGFFTSKCQRDLVSSSLLALLNIVQDEPNINYQTQLASNASTTAALSVSQLVVFNSVKQSCNSKPSVNV